MAIWVLCGHLWERADHVFLGWALKGSGGISCIPKLRKALSQQVSLTSSESVP